MSQTYVTYELSNGWKITGPWDVKSQGCLFRDPSDLSKAAKISDEGDPVPVAIVLPPCLTIESGHDKSPFT